MKPSSSQAVFLCLSWVCSLALLTAGRLPAQDPVVVFVHGRGQTSTTPQATKQAFVDGFGETERRLYGKEVIPRSDMVLVWYADAIDPKSATTTSSSTCRFLQADTVAGSDALRRALVVLAERLHVDRLGMRLLTSDTYTYLSSRTARCEADARLESELMARQFATRPLIVVAHSMGGIVAFSSIEKNAQVIQASSRLRIAEFVTLGTQVGLPLIVRGLEGSYVKSPLPLPGTVTAWTNFMNQGDKLAFSTHNAFFASNPARRPRDIPIREHGSRHDLSTYLASTAVVSHIVRTWCGQATRPPHECLAILSRR